MTDETTNEQSATASDAGSVNAPAGTTSEPVATEPQGNTGESAALTQSESAAAAATVDDSSTGTAPDDSATDAAPASQAADDQADDPIPTTVSGDDGPEVPQDGVPIPAPEPATLADDSASAIGGANAAVAAGRPPQPPVDNDHVAPGAELFATQPRKVLIPPVIGRHVWFFRSLAHADQPDEKPRAAIIADVIDASRVNLTVFDHDGTTRAQPNVPLLQPDDLEPPAAGPFAIWMPFQTGQVRAAQSPGSPGLAKN